MEYWRPALVGFFYKIFYLIVKEKSLIFTQTFFHKLWYIFHTVGTLYCRRKIKFYILIITKMSKETLWSHWWEWGKQPTLLYSTNENIWTTFSQKMKREEERLAWEIREKELEADRIKSETSKRELELEMFIWNFDDGLWKLKEELEHLALKSLSVTPYRTETHEIWDWEDGRRISWLFWSILP